MQIVETQNASLFISSASLNVLRQSAQYNEIRILLNDIDVLLPSRYHTRWTRRIRETTGLSREDSAMIALTSFGTNQAGNILGTHYLVTYDKPMINGYQNYLPALQTRLSAMTHQLLLPFCLATLPQLITPDDFAN